MNQAVSTKHRALVARILASESFHKSGRSRQLLEYLSEHHFAGHADGIHEARIGAELFERGQDFDPSVDSIVRASMRQLRQRLSEYYLHEGVGEQWELSIPKGEYRLQFVARQDAAPQPADGGTEWQSAPAAKSAQPAELGAISRSLLPVLQTWVKPVAVAASLLAAFFLGSSWQQDRGPSSSAPTLAKVERHDSILEHVLDSTKGPMQFVPSDSVVNLLQNFSGTVIPFEEYRSRAAFALDHPSSRRDPAHWQALVTRELLNIGDASIVLRAAREYPHHISRIGIRQSRDLQARDLRSGNYIFLGSINANPWVSVFEPELHFQFLRSPQAQQTGWRNPEPRDGELSRYPSEVEPTGAGQSRPKQSYAHVALTNNLSHSGKVLIVAGVSQPDTEAAGEFVLAPGSARMLREALGVPDLRQVPGFEVVLRTEQTGNTWRVAEVVAHRIHRTQVSFSREPSRAAFADR